MKTTLFFSRCSQLIVFTGTAYRYDASENTRFLFFVLLFVHMRNGFRDGGQHRSVALSPYFGDLVF